VITVNALIDTSAKVTILDMDFVEEIMMPCINRKNRVRLETADGSLLMRSGTVRGPQYKIG